MSILKVNKLRAYNTTDITIEDPVVFENSVNFERLDPGNFTGMIAGFAMNAVPDGWLVADGSAVSRTTYATLFGKIGTTWGAGDSSTTFNLPDMRETVAVGTGTRGSGVTAHDTYDVGEFKDDQIQDHAFSGSTNTTGAHSHSTTMGAHTGATTDAYPWRAGDVPSGSIGTNSTGNHSHTVTADTMTEVAGGSPRKGNVTHGKQAGVLYCIKY